MSEQPAWAGKVDASLKNGQATGLQLENGDVISVLATGWIRFGPDDTQWSAPQSPIPRNKSDYDRNPALVARIGTEKKTYPVGNGLLHWPVPAQGMTNSGSASTMCRVSIPRLRAPLR